ncbi:unnamed protein product [Auanema sp. JU1783]|nr:unnamed protein product [Auanema sp. JU1783]
MKWTLFIVSLIFVIPIAFSCPEVIQQFCKCEENNNGVRLDCSNSNGNGIVQLLRENQVRLGLIQSLTLKNAELTSIPKNFFEGLFIKQLDLSHNDIKTVDNEAFGGMSNVLTDISLSNNKLTKIPTAAISFQRSLFRLDLSNNTIGDLRSDDIFPSLPKLFDINLSGNKICKIQGAVFEKLKNVLQTLNLGRNCLSAVPSQAIRGQTQLQSLHLHFNNISSLEALSFLNLPVLQLLNLANNAINDINTQAFINVPNLRYLYLTNNRIGKLISHQFNSFEKLEFLDLTNNLLEKVPSGAFSDHTYLRQVYLGNNSITELEKDAFLNSSIVILVISNNKISELPEDVITGLPSLQQLSFKNNEIRIIHQNAFHNIPSTVVLDLSYNKIENLEPNTFLAQINLLFIDLSHNKFAKTPHEILNRRTGTVVLKENPLVCTENLHMVQDGVGIYIPKSEDIICNREKPKTDEKPSLITEKIEESPVSTGKLDDSPIITETVNVTTEEPEIAQSSLRIRPSSLLNRKKPENTLLRTSEIVRSEQRDDIQQDTPREQETSTLSVVTTTSSSNFVPRRPEDNPNRILPFPIPFLKMAPNNGRQVVRVIRPVSSTTPSIETTESFSLPPSIIIASKASQAPSDSKPSTNSVDFERFALRRENEETVPKISKSKSLPTTAIIICLSTVIVIMLSVFVILCAVRHKSSRQSSRRFHAPRGLQACDLY